MTNGMSGAPILFLAWGSVWPAHSGAALRTLGLLKEVSKAFEVELLLLSRRPLSDDQTGHLSQYANRITRVPLRDVSLADKLRVLSIMAARRYPYHCAALDASFRENPDAFQYILNHPGVVYACFGHWGTLVIDRQAPNWILSQYDADVQFWRVYASQATDPLVRLAALVNWRLSLSHFPKVYGQVGRVISVCEEDKQLTLELAPSVKIDVIPNGVDCSFYVPRREARTGPPRLLFTGTSAVRNVAALQRFVRNVFPLVLRQLPEAELLVGGDFSSKAQARFREHPRIRFTGRVGDMRPIFDRSDVFVAPFEETHGSKLKVAEAMAMAMAIVATPAGIRGFPLVGGQSVEIASGDEVFAQKVLNLLASAERRERMGKAARQVALHEVDWPVLGRRLTKMIVEEVKANSQSRWPHPSS